MRDNKPAEKAYSINAELFEILDAVLKLKEENKHLHTEVTRLENQRTEILRQWEFSLEENEQLREKEKREQFQDNII